MVLDPRRPEADIEGAAIDGAIIYWVSSHGRSAKGRPRPSRLQFFATRLADDGTTVRLEAYGKPYTRLLDALVALGFGEDINLEGLAVTHQGNVLLGFRSPTPGGKALVVPLSNPADLVQGAEPRFGEPLLLDLGGLGIRSLERFGDGYLVAAGPASDERRGRLFRWDGAATVTPVDVELGDFMPEALVVRDRSVLMLSDDGALRVGDKECKRSSAKRFRGRTVELP